jgi:hypothetical protein
MSRRVSPAVAGPPCGKAQNRPGEGQSKTRGWLLGVLWRGGRGGQAGVASTRLARR